MFKKTYFLVTVAVATLATLTATSTLPAQKPLALKGAKIITMAGDTIENGTIVFRDGKSLPSEQTLKSQSKRV